MPTPCFEQGFSATSMPVPFSSLPDLSLCRPKAWAGIRMAVVCLGLSLPCFPAMAENKQASSLPPFAFPRDDVRERAARENWTLAPVPLPESRNAYLSGILSLQSQIGLIQKLSERQESLTRLEEAYNDLGIPFTPPPPPRSVCEKIPPSVVCVTAYPDLMRVSLPPEDLEETPIPTVEAPQTREETPEPEEIGPAYRWTDVSCAGGNCRAVLVDEDDAGTRRTVSEGDALPDGTIVSRISFEGVRVTQGGKDITLMPAVAPSRGGSASPLFAARRISQKSADPKPSSVSAKPSAPPGPEGKTGMAPSDAPPRSSAKTPPKE